MPYTGKICFVPTTYRTRCCDARVGDSSTLRFPVCPECGENAQWVWVIL